MAKSASDSDPDSKPVSSLFWRSVLNTDDPRSPLPQEGFGAGGGCVKSEEKPQQEEEAVSFAKRSTTLVKQEDHEDNGGSYDIRYGRRQELQQQQQHHRPILFPTSSALAVPSTTRRPIQQYPAEVWEAHKAHLHHLYIQQGKSLKQIQQIMAQRGFNASDKMYKDRFSKWGFRKNRRAMTRDKVEAHSGSSIALHAHHRNTSAFNQMDGMMHTQDCYAHFMGTTMTTTRDYKQQRGGQVAEVLPLAYFHDALYDSRPRLPDTYLVQDQLLRCFDRMAAKAWATGELKPGDSTKIMYVTPEVHRRVMRIFNVYDYASVLANEPPHCRPSAAMRKGFESVTSFVKNPSLLPFLRLLQLTIYAGPITQLPAVWHHIAHSPQFRQNCSVPGLHEVFQNMDRLIGSYPPGGGGGPSPFVDLVIDMLPRLEAMVRPTGDASAWTPARQLRDMLRRLLLATSHRRSLSDPLRRYTFNSELLVRELLEVLESGDDGGGRGGGGGEWRGWHICGEVSAALPREVRLDLALFRAFKHAEEDGNWWQRGELFLDRARQLEREDGRPGVPAMDDLQRRLLLILQANVHRALWELEREKHKQKQLRQFTVEEKEEEEELLVVVTTDKDSAPPGKLPPHYTNAYGKDSNESNARLGLAIALRRRAMDFIRGAEQREHGERVEDLATLETWYRELGDATSAEDAARQIDMELEKHLATLTI